MIFYFTGTGNSLYVANSIAEKQQDKIISIGNCFKSNWFEFTLRENESVGFVFPVYFYGLPSIVVDFIGKINLLNYSESTYTYTVITCGGNSGNAMNRFSKLLHRKGFHNESGFSVVMPDNYIILFNLLPPERKRSEILRLAEPHISEINNRLSNKIKGFYVDHKGAFARLISFFSHPLYRYGRKTKNFYYTTDCVGCGFCERVCPVNIIHMVKGVPVWDKGRCTQCLACVHRCPQHAIQYGSKTKRRERYFNPNVTFE